MKDIETRLRDAAAEVRDVGRRSPRQAISPESKTSRRWPAFALAFVTVMVVGLTPWLLGGGQENLPVGDTSTPTTVTSTSLSPTTTPDEACSARGVDLPATPEALPPAVAGAYTAIAQAASACDVAALSGIAVEDFTTSFGGGGIENLELWEGEGTGQLGTLLKVLSTSHATAETEDGRLIYVWPAAFAYDSWDEIPHEYIEELTSLYTEQEIDQIAEFGVYAGWRTGIDENGNWLFFVAGD